MGSWDVGVSFGGHHSPCHKAEPLHTSGYPRSRGSSHGTPRVQPWVGETWCVVGGLSRVGGLSGTKPWPGCLSAGSPAVPGVGGAHTGPLKYSHGWGRHGAWLEG